MSGPTTLGSRLRRVRGLGSAREGAARWWAQRLTAIALVPLVFWFVASLAALSGAGHGEVVAWLRGPIAPVAMIALLVVGFHHLQLGLQEVIEDYVHTEAAKFTLIIAIKGGAALAALVSILSVLRIALGS
ncbi:MAG: succinate dehydrogenase, hydrophobic membrane anchor protein [Alphaproteobacteria bacterium]|nr:succinate dehydrogenase, hydrophobic membrane anchor protein [Alphaproteobacteria bacterium]MCZ6495975.1 succinate dehydrogenase, hydrophobic membrane anchor protein [Alphaproteobacteria bacterium]MCZ6610046.1 succinate dehydrogenase, hydrophobic membrane anchor protein [Alphaproteobacteria bacterium]MCZ6741992.1 succinate dehydrogenase, hydrophobic membrane anchor protein [Alphaproteobacteria bacterium]MCZ6849369.1 succinate dehydrogenase, hydrophobic membrane anchor protein [Alphaproteobac